MSYFEKTQVAAADSPSVDAFGRWRVSNPVTIAEHSFEYDERPVWFDQSVMESAGIAHNATTRQCVMTISTTAPNAITGTLEVTGTSNPRTATFSALKTFATGDVIVTEFGVVYEIVTGTTDTVFSVNGLYNTPAGSTATWRGSCAVMRQKIHNVYEKGKSQLVKITGLFGAAVENVTRQMGYYDYYNGVFLMQTNTAVSIVLRSYITGAVVDTAVAQSSWNIDAMDGSGPSGITLDLQYGVILMIDMQFLGVGRVRVGFDIGGMIYYVHQFVHANATASIPYWQAASMPCGWEIFNTDTSAGATMSAICMEVESEGGSLAPNHQNFSISNTADVSATTSRTHLLSIRPAQQFNSLPNRISFVVDMSNIVVGLNAVLVEILYNSTLTGGSWAAVNGTYSAMEYNSGASLSVAGIVVDAFFASVGGVGGKGIQTSDSINNQYPITLDMFGANPDVITIVATALTGTSNCRASINWEEIH